MSIFEISDARLRELLEIYGADELAWPEAERDAAKARLASAPETYADALQQARDMDAALTGLPLPEPSSDLSARILATAPGAVQSTSPVRGIWRALGESVFPQGFRWPVGAMLASLAMGVVGGYAYAGSTLTYDAADTAYETAFGASATPDWLSIESGS